MKTISFYVISGDSNVTRFMQHADLFESFKVVASVKRMEADVVDEHTEETLLPKVKAALEENGQLVVAIFSPNCPKGAWRDESIKVISDGTHWQMLDDVLKAYHFVKE